MPPTGKAPGPILRHVPARNPTQGVRLMYAIWSIEHNGWWRLGRHGYTQYLSEAGKYSRAEAEEIIRDANLVNFNECMIPMASLDRPFD